MISIQVRGLDEFAAKISTMPRGARGAATQAMAFTLIGNERTGLKHYPAPPPASSYVRTFMLRFGWVVSGWGDGVNLKIRNAVEYAPYVQGNKDQAWMHVGRWKTVAQTIQSNRAAILRAAKAAVSKYLRSRGW
jgi:hypothetical protein